MLLSDCLAIVSAKNLLETPPAPEMSNRLPAGRILHDVGRVELRESQHLVDPLNPSRVGALRRSCRGRVFSSSEDFNAQLQAGRPTSTM